MPEPEPEAVVVEPELEPEPEPELGPGPGPEPELEPERMLKSLTAIRPMHWGAGMGVGSGSEDGTVSELRRESPAGVGCCSAPRRHKANGAAVHTPQQRARLARLARARAEKRREAAQLAQAGRGW